MIIALQCRMGKLDLQVSLGVLAWNEGGCCHGPLLRTPRTPSDSFTACHAVKGHGISSYQPAFYLQYCYKVYLDQPLR